MISRNTAISVNKISKVYRIGLKERIHDSLGRATIEFMKSPLKNYRRYRSLYRFEDVDPEQAGNSNNHQSDIIWALRDVSFEVKKGEVIGIIGKNGAGKSTLLKILSKITEPTSGRAEIRGRVSSLLEVGTGFHQELTGRENVYLNGTILGMRKAEIDRRFDEIVDFSGIEKFIDTPVKRYSTGMKVRLAFSVAAHMEPEILLVDEVLAVGDAAFQKKSLGKMGDVAKEGRTVMLVSHHMAAVQQLTRTSLLLHDGRLISNGSTGDVVQQYLNMTMDHTTTVYQVENVPRRHPDFQREIEYLTVELENYPTKLVPADAEIHVRITVRGNESVDNFRFSMSIKKVDGTPVGNFFGPEIHSIKQGEVATYRVELGDLRLAPGMYYCNMAVGKGNHHKGCFEFDHIAEVLHFEVMPEEGPDGTTSGWWQGWGSIRFKEPKITRIA